MPLDWVSDMNDLEYGALTPDQEKWQAWTMQPKKAQPKTSIFTSAIVLVTATLLIANGSMI